MYGQGDRRGFNQRNPPVNVGDELDVRIEAVGEKGDGLAKKDGFVLIVPGAKENEEVRIKVTRVLRQVGFAEVVGKAEGPIADDKPQQRQRERVREARSAPQEEFNYDESKDSESFGDESEEQSPSENLQEDANQAEEQSSEEPQDDSRDLTQDPEEESSKKEEPEETSIDQEPSDNAPLKEPSEPEAPSEADLEEVEEKKKEE